MKSNQSNATSMQSETTPDVHELAEVLYRRLRKIGQFVWGENGELYFWRYGFGPGPYETRVRKATDIAFQYFVRKSIHKSPLEYNGRKHRLRDGAQFHAVLSQLLGRARASLVQSFAGGGADELQGKEAQPQQPITGSES